MIYFFLSSEFIYVGLQIDTVMASCEERVAHLAQSSFLCFCFQLLHNLALHEDPFFKVERRHGTKVARLLRKPYTFLRQNL